MLPTWVRIFDKNIVEVVPVCEILIDQKFQKTLLVWTHLGIQTYTSSTVAISFYYHQGVTLDSFLFEADCSLLSMS